MALRENTCGGQSYQSARAVLKVADKIMSSHPSIEDCAIRQAALEDIDVAYAIVGEYYEAAAVVARDSREEFARFYFGVASGLWLAVIGDCAVGCIALRPLRDLLAAAEVKRLYVQPYYRGLGIAAKLYASLETYAAESGYQWLYLDTAAGMNTAQRFYAMLSYEPCERYNDNPQASLFMRRELKPFSS